MAAQGVEHFHNVAALSVLEEPLPEATVNGDVPA
jgi:hypothetical protein